MMSISLTIYMIILVAVAAQRIAELRASGRNTELLVKFGAEEVASGHYTAMRLLHTSWLAACAVEAYCRDALPPLWMVALGLIGLTIGQMLRLSAMRALGPRWTTRILVMPGLPPVTEGIYSWLRHPNYLGVILELAALPLIFGGVITSVVFSIANLALLLGIRIPAEEAALIRVNNYSAHLDGQGRLVTERSKQ